MIISKNGVKYELKGSPWYLDADMTWIYFPAQQLLILWKEGSTFSSFYDEDTSEQQLDSWHKIEDVLGYMHFYDMKNKKESFDALKDLADSTYKQGRERIKFEFRKMVGV